MPRRKITSPPPVALHFSIVRLIAPVSFVLPSPVAPKSRTLKLADLNCGGGKFGGVHESVVSARTKIDHAQNRSVVEIRQSIDKRLFHVDFANAFLLTNRFDLVSDLVGKSDMMRNRFGQDEW